LLDNLFYFARFNALGKDGGSVDLALSLDRKAHNVDVWIDPTDAFVVCVTYAICGLRFFATYRTDVCHFSQPFQIKLQFRPV
jgi:hypothetical protein